MVELARFLTQTEILVHSDMLGTLILYYLYLLIVLFVSFINIYSVDEYEFLHNEQKCWKFKHRMYLIFILTITVFICSLKQTVTVAIILLAFVAIIIITFGCITGCMYRKIKKR